MFFVCVELNLELEEGLESAFKQTNCMFNAYADLEEISISRRLQEITDLTYLRQVVIEGSLIWGQFTACGLPEGGVRG